MTLSILMFCSNDIGYEKREETLVECHVIADQRNQILESNGNDSVGTWRAMDYWAFMNEVLGHYDCYDLTKSTKKLP